MRRITSVFTLTFLLLVGVGLVQQAAGQLTTNALFAGNNFGQTNQVWRYEEVADLTGTGWEQPGYNDMAWQSGQALLAFESSGWILPFRNTIIMDPRLASNPPPGHARYFRTHFTWTGSAAGGTLVFNARCDDGAVFYLNGVEVFRLRPPPDPITHASVGSPLACGGDADCGDDVFTVTSPALVEGDNVLAVAVYQNATGSSDIVWGTGLAGIPGVAPTITNPAEPHDLIVTANRMTNLSVFAAGSPAPSYQWYKDGGPIDPGVNATAITSSYVISNMTSADAGSYFCRVSNPQGMVDSRTAVVGFNDDTNGPVLVEAVGSASFDRIIVQFNEVIEINSAQDAFNYGIEGPGGSSLGILSAILNANGSSVTLTTDPQTPDTLYTITVNSVIDLAGNAIEANSTIPFRSWVLTTCAGVIFETFNVNNRLGIDDLLNNQANFPNNPRERSLITGFDTRLIYAGDEHEDYAGRMRGLFIPPVSGNWIFHLRSDDPGRLYVNKTGSSAAGKVQVANEGGCCQAFLPVGAAQTSQPIPLQAGRAYYVECLWREFGGGDYAQVAASLQGTPTPTDPATQSIQGGQVGVGAAPAGIAGPVTITSQPADVTVFANTLVSFSVAAQNETEILCYQWQRSDDGGANFSDIMGATLPTYGFGPVSVADNGALFRCNVGTIGASAASRDALLRVNQDTNAPLCVSATALSSLSNVVVRFSEFIDMGTAQDSFNYSVPGFMVLSAVLNADAVSVRLTLDPPLSVDSSYSVTIQNVQDLAGNTISPNPCTLNFRTPVISCGFALQELYFNIGGGVAVTDLTGHPSYPNNPGSATYVGLLEGPLNTFDNYGTRLTGWLIPPVSGNYNFFMSSDDGGQFMLSTDASPANLQRICFEPVWANPREYTGDSGARRNGAAPENQSSTLFPGGIPLTAGQMYFFEALAKEGGGGDNLSVAWQLPGGPVPANGSSPISGAFIGSLADPVGAMLNITQQPTDQTFIIASDTLLANDFNSNDGGFTVQTPLPFDGPWRYDGALGAWRADGQTPEDNHPNTSLLISPSLAITKAGQVRLTFTHSYNFEFDGTRWDGGQVRVSVNGGAFTAVPNAAFSQNGYGGNSVAGNSTSQLAGQPAFTASSAGPVTSIAILGTFNLGDTIQVQFFFGADGNTSPGDPDWAIDRIQVDQGVAGAQNVTFSVAASASRPGQTNPPIFYQWYCDNGSGFVALNGANSANLTLIPTLADNGNRYRCAIYIPGATVTSASALLTVAQPNTPPRFTCGPNQTVPANAGAQAVLGFASDIVPHSIQRNRTLNFNTLPQNTELHGVAAVNGGNCKLTTPVNSVFGHLVMNFGPAQTFSTFQASWKSYIGDGAGGGADGYSFSIGTDLPYPPTYGNPGEEGAGTGLIVAVDTFDNADVEVPDVGIEIVWQGNRVAFGAIPKDNPGNGVFLRKSAFVNANLTVDAAGQATFDYDGTVISAQLPGFAGITATRLMFGARTGGANDNQWIDDLTGNAWIEGFLPPDPSNAESGQMVQFLVSNDNPSLFSAQPAISPDGTLTYTTAPDACGVAHVTAIARDDGGTAFGGDDTSDPCQFTITVAPCPPRITCPPNVIAECTGGLTPVTFTVTAVDGSGNPIPVTCVPPSGTGFRLGVSNVVCTATDTAGISASCAFTVTVVDTTPPRVMCSPNIIVRNATPPGAVATYIASASDACGIATFECLPPSGSVFACGTNRVVCTATDSVTNLASCLFLVIVECTDNVCPTAVAKASPECDIGPNATRGTIVISGNNIDACVVLDGSMSSDADGDPLTYVWLADLDGDGAKEPIGSGAIITNCFELGIHNVMLMVDDGKCSGTASVTIEVLSACEAVELLIERVDNADLGRRNKRPLIASLKAACASFDRGNCVSGVNQLEAFQNKTRAQIGRDNPALADALIAFVDRLLDCIDCEKGNNGSGNGDDPQPPGNPPRND